VRVLFVSYVFPPAGGAGVQRLVKWVRYLPEFGVTPVVLTAANASVPVRDDTLANDVPPEIRIVRAATLEPGYAAKQLALATARPNHKKVRRPAVRGWAAAAARSAGMLLYPDPQVLWIPGAIGKLGSFIRGLGRIDGAVITAPPFSAFLLLPWLQRRLGIPVVLDYRDEWTTTLAAGHDHTASRFSQAVSNRLESWLLTNARAVTTATDEYRTALLARFPKLDPTKLVFLPNGFDPRDLPPHTPLPHGEKFVLTYAGTVFRLTSLRGLLAALRLLRERNAARFRRLEVRIYGRVAPAEEDSLSDAESLGIKRFGYVSHADVLSALSRSHVNLCVLDDVPGAERIYPAKAFELMALRRRCLVLAPPGALERLARRHDMGEVVGPRDVEAIANTIEGYLERWERDAFASEHEPKGIERYDRRALAGELARVLSRVVGSESAPAGELARPPAEVA
jgi:hypothetical protein